MGIVDNTEGSPHCKASERKPWRGCEGGCCIHEEAPGNTCERCGTTVCKG